MQALFVIALIIYQGTHVSSEGQQTQPQPVGQTSEGQQPPQRPASTFLGQMLANLINYKLRWLSVLADRLAGNSSSRWPNSYSYLTTNMATPTTLHSTPTTQHAIPTTQPFSATTAQHNIHPHVSPGRSEPPPSTSHASYPSTDTLSSTHDAHSSPTSHPAHLVHSPQTTSVMHISPQMHSAPSTPHPAQPTHSPQATLETYSPAQPPPSPSNAHSVQPAHEPASAVPHSPSVPHAPQASHSPSTDLPLVATSNISPISSDHSPVPLSEDALESSPNLDSVLPMESTASSEISTNNFSDESPPVGSSNPVSPPVSKSGVSIEPEVSDVTSQVSPGPNPVPVEEGAPIPPPLSTPLPVPQPSAQSALDWY